MLEHFTIRTRLFVTTVLMLGVLIAVFAFGAFVLDRLKGELDSNLGSSGLFIEAVNSAGSAQAHFKIQVQEWKNILLRGSDKEAFRKYEAQFTKEEAITQERLKQLKTILQKLNISGAEADRAVKLHRELGAKYRAALASHDPANPRSYRLVDQLVKGIDREVTENIDGLVKTIVQKSADDIARTEKQATAQYSTLRSSSMAVLVVIIGLSLGAAFLVVHSVSDPLRSFRDDMLEIQSASDLSRRARVRGNNEIAHTANAFNQLIGSFEGIVGQVRGDCERLSDTATQLSATSSQVTQSSHTQSEAAATTAAAVEQITVSISAVAQSADQVHHLSKESLERTRKGNESLSELVGEVHLVESSVNEIATSVNEFVKSTGAITGMTKQVKDIAEQTNLLALNAAIEAARAGEQGRGFAVVADEVRKLAEKSAQSASEIDAVTRALGEQSERVGKAIQKGLQSLQSSQDYLENVAGALAQANQSVTHAAQGVDDITTSVKEQTMASNEIARNVERIAQMAEENHAASDQASQAAALLEQLARNLENAVGRFKVSLA